ncbi:MAG: hypothetical protein ACP5VQ_02330 [Phycisphaerae bacterium]
MFKCQRSVFSRLRDLAHWMFYVPREGEASPLVMLLTLMTLFSGAIVQAADADTTAKSQSPTLAVLPFVPAARDAKSLARRMRFAVAQKMSRDGHYNRVNNHDVNAIIETLQMPWTPPVTTKDIQTVIKALATDQTVAGFVRGRRLTLELFVGSTLTKKVSASIPPNNISPRLTIEKMLTDLANVQFHHVRSWQINPSPALQQLFNLRPNLVRDPNFAQAARFGNIARNWDVFLLQQDYHPPLVTVAEAKTLAVNHAAIVPQSMVTPGARGYCLMLRTNLLIAQNNGLACESTWIAVTQGHRYRFTVQYHSDAPRIRIFINGYDYNPDQFSRAHNRASQRREIYRCQVLPVTKNVGWGKTGIDFTPEALKGMRKQHPVHWVRIDFFSYLNAGDAFFRAVELRDITPVVK